MRYSSLYSYMVSLAVASMLVAGCSDGGGDKPDPDPTQYTKPIMAKDSESDQALDQLTFVVGSDTTENVSKITLTREENTSERVTVMRTGYAKKTQTIRFESDAPVSIALSKQAPKSVAVTVDPKLDGKTDADAEIFAAESDQKLGKGKTTLTRKTGTELVLRISGPDITTAEKTLVFDNKKTVTVTLEHAEPKTVTLTITPEIDAFDAKKRGRDADDDAHTEYRITVDGKTFTNHGPDGGYLNEGTPLSVSVEKGSSPITISGRFVYFKDGDTYAYAGVSLAEGETSVSPDGDKALTLTLAHQPACSDGINNDFATDEVADENDSGCVKGFGSRDPSSADFRYEASDDNEVLLFTNVSASLPSHGDVDFVSSKKGERRAPIAGNMFQPEIKFAVGEIDFYLDNKIETAQTGEEAAVELKCKPKGSDANFNTRTPYLSDIIPDDQSMDGWRQSPVHGYTRSIFKTEGIDCTLDLLDGTLARGEPTGAGDDDVVIATPERDGLFGYRFGWEEEVAH